MQYIMEKKPHCVLTNAFHTCKIIKIDHFTDKIHEIYTHK